MRVLHFLQRILHVMHSVLRRLDLNLLLVFDALYRLRTVARAAEELSISSSAFSHALSRLRSAFNDELFLRAGGVMSPTPRADELSGSIGEALQLLSKGIGDASNFDPSTSEQTFIFSATDFTSFALLPTLIAHIEQVAPRVQLRVVASQSRNAISDLTAGAHFALGFSDELSATTPGIERIEAAPGDYVVVARRGHPRIGKSLTMTRYMAERHVVVKPWRQEQGVIDEALGRKGLARSIAVEIPSVMAAPFIIARSDLLITLPRAAAQALAEAAQVELHSAPFVTPAYTPTVLFQRHHIHVAWHRWMRNQIVSALA